MRLTEGKGNQSQDDEDSPENRIVGRVHALVNDSHPALVAPYSGTSVAHSCVIGVIVTKISNLCFLAFQILHVCSCQPALKLVWQTRLTVIIILTGFSPKSILAPPTAVLYWHES